jgi:CBS domain-containing protein
MAKLVNSFIENIQEPITVKRSDSFSDALTKMLENDFSQLPVVNEQSRPIGFVTYQSIARTLIYRDTPRDDLLVADVYEEIDKAQILRGDESLSSMLDRLRDTNAILFVDVQEKLIGIFTAADSTEYLRARSEDLLYVQDIESTIKDLLRFIFQQVEDEPDNARLCQAIKNITKTSLISKREYAKALQNYLGLASRDDVNQIAMAKSYDELISESSEMKSFSELTFGDYIALLLHRDQRSQFGQLFNHPPDHVQNLLDNVRKIRNQLAHLRPITSVQRDQLRHCKQMLDRMSIPKDWQKALQQVSVDHIHEQQVDSQSDSIPIAPTAEESLPGESRYSPFAVWLNSQPGGTDMVQLSFEQIEKLIDGELPSSAYDHRAWWANDSQGHPHSQLWLEAGWRTSYVNMTERRVNFVRIRERQQAYINFFSKLLAQLREKAGFAVRETSPGGSSWAGCYAVNVNGSNVAQFGFGFIRNTGFRIELYIDTGNKESNKQTFDRIRNHETDIETKIGQITWERIDDKKASRVALYHSGAITDNEDQLELLRNWAVDKMIIFIDVIEPIARQAFEEVLKP